MTDHDSQSRRRWFQFRLRTLLLFTAALSLPLSWVPYERRALHKQQEAAKAIDELGDGTNIFRDAFWQQSPWRKWLFGDLDQAPVVFVILSFSQVTDAGLAHLAGLTQLQVLFLNGTQISDAGLAHLAGLTQLEGLDLDGTQISDAGLAHLAGLTQLLGLFLDRTQISDAGLAHLAGLTQLQRLYLDGTPITDAGLANFAGWEQLRVITLKNTRVTDEGVATLPQVLPNLYVDR